MPEGVPLVDIDAADTSAVTAPVIKAVDAEAPAYVIHTSGSTGKPKGVVVLHRNLTAFLAAMDQVVGTGGEPVTWLAVTSVSFDISVLELLWTAGRGHRVVIGPDKGVTAPDTTRDVPASAETVPGTAGSGAAVAHTGVA